MTSDLSNSRQRRETRESLETLTFLDTRKVAWGGSEDSSCNLRAEPYGHWTRAAHSRAAPCQSPEGGIYVGAKGLTHGRKGQEEGLEIGASLLLPFKTKKQEKTLLSILITMES